MTIRIVTDSTADIPAKMVEQYGIGVVPLNVNFGDEALKDGVDIWSDEFYHRIRNEAIFPTTSQPAPGEFVKAYEEIAEPGDTIISLHLSGEMSGTVGSAKIAADMLADKYRIEVIDSRYVCIALGVMVLRLAQMAQTGATVEEILKAIPDLQNKLEIIFTVNSLEYLYQTGRIGKATSYLGGLLNIKPILGVEDGLIAPVDRVRGNFQKVAVAIVNRFVERYGDAPLEMWFLHSEIPELADTLEKEAKRKLNIAQSYIGVIGPIVGVHAGPYAAGIIGLPI